MTPESIVVLLLVALVVGGLIGAVGVGGVLLVPALVLVGGLDVTEATPVATLSFLFTGIAGTIAYQAEHRIVWSSARWLVWAAIPGAVLGAVANLALNERVITLVVASILVLAALQAWRVLPEATGRGPQPAVWMLLGVGIVVGFGSTLSGTGGPVLLIPALLLVGTSTAFAVGSSQPIQIPIAVFGTASFLAYGDIDWRLAIAVGLLQAVGAVMGARVSRGWRSGTLRILVGWALIAASLVFLTRAVVG